MNLVAPGPPVFQGNGPAAAQCGGVGVEPGLARPVGCPAMSGFRK